jgi:sigma-B regulation protein RsbU (phosphoserine phosphatase)
METIYWQYHFKPELSSLHEARSQLLTYLIKIEVPVTKQRALILSMSEWVANIIKYAPVKPNQIHLRISGTDHEKTLMIEDDGAPFGEFEHYMQQAVNLADLVHVEENGHGLSIIKHYFPNHCYKSSITNRKKCNTITLPISGDRRLSKLIIAVIDDSPTVCQVIKQFLQDEYVIETFLDAASFLLALRQLKVDLIISDIIMPDISGLELRKELSSLPNTDIIPFVFLTSNENADIEERANELGIDDFIHKPINKQHLQSIIKRVLTRKKSERTVMGAILDEKVTQALRPQLPKFLGNYHCALWCKQASAGGGDFIVHLLRPDNHIIVLGDVMGHGLAAKFFAHIYAGYIQGLIYSLHKEKTISDILQNLSILIEQDPYLESIIVTCIGLSLESNNKVWIANAGHPKPLLVNEDDVHEVTETGSLPGLIPNITYTAECIDLTDSRLIIYTDGFIEISKEASQREKARHSLYDILSHSRELSLDDLMIKLSDYFQKFSEHSPVDDATVIVLEAS